jgi:hypothetical protein
VVGFGVFGKIFTLKAITIIDNSRIENSEEFKIGMEIGRKCELNKGNKLNELLYIPVIF